MSLPAEAAPPDPTADVAAYRRAVGHFASGVTVCTSRVGGTDHAMTASAFTSVSLEPLLVLVCVDKEARFRDAVLEDPGAPPAGGGRLRRRRRLPDGVRPRRSRHRPRHDRAGRVHRRAEPRGGGPPPGPRAAGRGPGTRGGAGRGPGR